MAVKPSEEYHSRMLVEGTEVTDPITLDVDQGDSVNVTLYPAKGLEGTFGFYDYAGLLDDEKYVHNFSFKMYEYTGSNDDISQFYWTLDDDPDTKHFAVKYNNYDWYMLVSIPIGHEVTMHNFPMNATLTSFNPGWDYDTHTNIWGTDCPDLTYLTYDGQNLTRDEIEDLGLSYDAFYDFDPGDNGGNTNWNLVMSGALKYHNWGDGFQWNIYISRRPAQFLFTKEYDPNDTTADPDETHTFRITLTDTVSGKPFADQDVVYYIYSFDGYGYRDGRWENDGSLTGYRHKLDDENNQLFAHTDENGVMEIEVPANCYVRIGRRAPYHLGEVRQLYNSEKSYFNGSEYCYMTGLGMLPLGIAYEIEEVGNDYSATVIGDSSASIDAWNESMPYDDGRWTQNDIEDLIDYLERDTGTYWGQPVKYPNVEIPRFINTRNTGSLTVEKIVTGYDYGDSFEFTLTLTDPATGFPTSIPYTLSDGTTGTADLTAGDPVEINGVDVPTYTYTFELKGGESITFEGIPSGTDYKVTESATSSAGYDVTYVDEEGEVETDGSTVTITNDLPVGSLEVKKVVTGDTTSAVYDEDTEYEINISFDTAGTYTVSENGGTGYEKAFEANEAVSFTLKADEKVLISNIPEGVGYTVTESALSDDLTDAGYATGNITKGTGTIEDDVKTQVTVNNTYTAPEETPTPTPETTPETTPEVTPVSSYTVVKSCDATGKNVGCGDQITYSITVTNTGDTDIVGIVVRDFIPEYTHYISCDSNGERGAIDGKQHVTWFIGTLGAGEEIVLKMTVEVNTCVPNGTKISNTAYYGQTGTPDRPGTNEDLPDSSTTTNEVTTSVQNTKVLSAIPSTGESGNTTILVSSILFVLSPFGILVSWRRWREDYEDSDL